MLTIMAFMVAIIFMGILWLLISPLGGIIVLAGIITLVVCKIVKKNKKE